MDNYEQQEATQAKAKIKFSISQDGEVKFDAQGLKEWEASDVISQVATQAKQQRQATQKLKEFAFTSELVMHGLALAFISVIAMSTGFVASRVILGSVQQPITTGVNQ